MDIIKSAVEKKLTGSTLGERHKSLNQLVREPPAEVLEDIKLSNKKQLDLVYMGRLANNTKDASIICELLKSEDSMVVSVALQSKWFFTATTHPHMANVHYFDREVFPHATYNAICRIVSTFGACLQDETVAEDLYSYVSKWYGKTLAVKLLPKCSVTFISSQIMDSLTDVPCAQMFYIYKKDKALALEYLEKYLSKERANKLPVSYSLKMNYNRVWKLLAEESPQLFFNLLDTYYNFIKVPLGHRVVKEILKENVEKIIKNPDKYSETITKKNVIKILKGDELERYLLNCMPSKIEDLDGYQSFFLNLKPAYRLKMLMKLHPIKYNGAAFTDRSDFGYWDLAKNFSKDDGVLWAKKKIENIDINNPYVTKDDYIKYLDSSYAIPRLQAVCRNTSDWYRRSGYLTDVLECCKINNDKDALLEVLKYVAKRHKNDNINLRRIFLRELSYGSLKLHELSSEYWDAINEMLEYVYVEVNTEEDTGSVRGMVYYLLPKYVHYCLLNGLDINSSIDKLIQYNAIERRTIVWNLQNPELETKVVNCFFDKYKQIITQTPEAVSYEVVITLVRSFTEMKENKIKSNMSITDHLWLIDFIKENWVKWDSFQLRWEIMKFPQVRKLLFNNEYFINADDLPVYKNYVMFNSDVIVNNMEHFIKKTAIYTRRNKYNKIYEKIHTYLMHPLGQKIIEALEKHMSEESVKESSQLGVDIMYLSYLLPPAQRDELIRAHAPKDLKVDLENNRHQYEVGRELAKYMKTINPPVQLDTLMPFVGGDYLKYSLSSLWSFPFRKSRSEAKMLILDLPKRPVSIRKHSFRMAYFLCLREDLLPLYKSFWEKERNSSIRDVLFSFTFKLLLTEENMDQYQDIWMTLKYFISSLSESDINIFKYLTRPQDIMPALVTDYSETSWKTLKQLAAKKNDVAVHVSALTKNLQSCIELLNEDFCKQIIMEYLSSVINNESDASSELFTFLVDYLVMAKDPEVQSKNVNSICSMFKEYINTNWNSTYDGEYKYRRIVRDFVLKCCTQSLDGKLELSPVNLLKTISEMLSSTLPPPSVLDLHIALNATIFYKELLLDPRFLSYSPDSPEVSDMECQLFERLGEKISMYLNDFCSQYGVAATGVFVKALNSWMCPLLNECKKSTLMLYFISGLMHGEVTQQCFLMAIDLIPVVSCDDTDNFKLYNELLTRIVKEGDVTVKIILNKKVELKAVVLHDRKK